jgi:hypothetical protein
MKINKLYNIRWLCVKDFITSVTKVRHFTKGKYYNITWTDSDDIGWGIWVVQVLGDKKNEVTMYYDVYAGTLLDVHRKVYLVDVVKLRIEKLKKIEKLNL